MFFSKPQGIVQYKLHVKGWLWCTARGEMTYDLTSEQAMALVRNGAVNAPDFEAVDWWELERIKTTTTTTLLASSKD